jgi:hypothetical protein
MNCTDLFHELRADIHDVTLQRDDMITQRNVAALFFLFAFVAFIVLMCLVCNGWGLSKKKKMIQQTTELTKSVNNTQPDRISRMNNHHQNYVNDRYDNNSNTNANTTKNDNNINEFEVSLDDINDRHDPDISSSSSSNNNNTTGNRIITHQITERSDLETVPIDSSNKENNNNVKLTNTIGHVTLYKTQLPPPQPSHQSISKLQPPPKDRLQSPHRNSSQIDKRSTKDEKKKSSTLTRSPSRTTTSRPPNISVPTNMHRSTPFGGGAHIHPIAIPTNSPHTPSRRDSKPSTPKQQSTNTPPHTPPRTPKSIQRSDTSNKSSTLPILLLTQPLPPEPKESTIEVSDTDSADQPLLDPTTTTTTTTESSK